MSVIVVPSVEFSFVGVASVAVAIVLSWIGFLLVRWRIVKGRYAHLPGPDNGWLGHIPEAIKNIDRFYDFESEKYKTFGVTHKSTLQFWRLDGMVRTMDARNVEYVLKTNFRNYVKSPKLRRALQPLIGNGIFRINHGYKGEYESWHRQRKTMSKIFFKNNFTGFLQTVFVRHANVLREVLSEKAKRREQVDAQQLMFAFTLDSIAEIGFGVDFDTLRKPHEVGNNFDTAQDFTFKRMLLPLATAPFVGKALYSVERELPRVLSKVDAFVGELIRNRRTAIATSQADSTKNAKPVTNKSLGRGARVGQDVLSIFLDPQTTLHKYTDEELRDISMSILLAGRDTTACTLSFALAELLQHNNIEQRLLAEMEEKLAHTTCFGGSQDVSMEDVTQRNMPYLHGFVYEILRLHPPVAVESKFCVKDDVWPDGSKIPANTIISISIREMGRDPKRWPDPMKIDPSRWHGKMPSAFEFPVFQAGPRICLGMNMVHDFL